MTEMVVIAKEESDLENNVVITLPENDSIKDENPCLEEPDSTFCMIRFNNQTVLGITCLLFFLFVVAEIIGALASNSLSLLGDAAAMSVDVFTYLTNMYAEYIKDKRNAMDKNTKLILEVYIPTLSVSSLLAVTGWITTDAIITIIDGGSGDNVDVMFLYAFASANFVVDVISAWMFYVRGDDILVTDRESFTTEQSDDIGPTKANLNMISALTHVGGDTLRTFSVFIAAVIATVSSTPSSLCDAWAAVVVAVTICAAVIPLIKEIWKAAIRLH